MSQLNITRQLRLAGVCRKILHKMTDTHSTLPEAEDYLAVDGRKM